MQQINDVRRRKWLVGALAVVLSASLLAGCGNKKTGAAASPSPSAAATAKPDPGTVVATYKDGKVTQSDFDKFIGATRVANPMFEQYYSNPMYQDFVLDQALTQLVTYNVLYGRTTDEQKKTAETKAKEYMSPLDSQTQQQKDQFDQTLKTNGITKDDFTNYLKDTSAVSIMMEDKVTDQMLKDEFDKANQGYKYYFDTVTVSHILVALKDPQGKDLRSKEDALKIAKDVQQKLTGGGDMAALAKEFSDDGGSKDNGGKYESQQLGVTNWVPAFKQAAETLPVGKISDPVETEYGYHVMRVDARKTMTFDEAKAELKNTAVNNMFNDFVTKELPTLDFQDKRPKPSPSPAASASPAASGSPAASPAPEASKK